MRREIAGIACRLLRRLKSHNDTAFFLSDFVSRILRHAGVVCDGGAAPTLNEAWLERVERDIRNSSASLRISASLFEQDIDESEKTEKNCDLYCNLDSIFGSLYASTRDPEARFQLLEAYSFLRNVFEYVFVLYMASRDEGVKV